MKTPIGTRFMRSFAIIGLGILLAFPQGCASPAQRIADEANRSGYSTLALPGSGHTLRAFFKRGEATPGELHVYLEGDGTPWLSRSRVAADPTTRNPLMLRLMAMDSAPALYLGRPCYDGHATDTGCGPLLWTHQRYSVAVVDSMAAALGRFLSDHPGFKALSLFGHSGGGALALLLAGRFPQTRRVVTLGANLDPTAWAQYHGYSPLQGSLDPTAASNPGYLEHHFVGSVDREIPPELLRAACRFRPDARLTEMPGFDHVCCWEQVWTELLARTQMERDEPRQTGLVRTAQPPMPSLTK